MEKRHARWAAGIGIIFVVSAVFVYGRFNRGGVSELECFQVGYLDITASAPLFIAQDRGLFEKNQVCVEANVFASSNQLVDALAAGRIDYVVETSAVPALALHAQSPGRFVVTAASTISASEPFDAILVRKDSVITEVTDLQGKRIAVFPGTTAAALLKAFLASQGLDTARVTTIPVPPQNHLASLKAGAVDAVHAYEPTWTIGRNDPALRELTINLYGRQLAPNPQGLSLLSTRSRELRPRDSQRLVRAFDEALNLMRTDNASSRASLSRRFSLPGQTVQEMHLLYMSPHDKIDWVSMERYVDLLVSVGELQSRPSLNDLRYE